MSLTIGKVAKASGLSVETIRYYEREGLLLPAGRSASGYRFYAESSVQRLRFIRRAKQLGFTLVEIRNLLMLSESHGDQSEIKALTQDKLTLIEQRIEDLQRMRTALQNLAERCPGQGCIDDCPIIVALNDERDFLENSQ